MRNTMRLLAALGLAVGLVAAGAPGVAAAAPTRVVWTELASPINVWFQAFPGGYVGTSTTCWDATPATIYTSRDGIHWTTPPDPRIFSTSDEGFCLSIYGPARGPAGYLLAGRMTDDGTPTIWQSRDGIRWTRNAVPSLYGIELSRIAPTRTGYLVGDGNGNYWTSTDGLDWTPAALDAFKLETGQPGEPMLAGGEGGISWFSLDGGRTWGETGVPKGMKLLEFGVARLGKVYYGDWEGGGTFKIYSTRDMRHWAPLKGPAMPFSLVAFGDRLYVASLGEGFTGTLYSSADGRKWSPVKDPSGRAIEAGSLQVAGGRLFVIDGNGAISRVASLR